MVQCVCVVDCGRGVRVVMVVVLVMGFRVTVVGIRTVLQGVHGDRIGDGPVAD